MNKDNKTKIETFITLLNLFQIQQHDKRDSKLSLNNNPHPHNFNVFF